MSPIKDVKHLEISLQDILSATNNFSQKDLIASTGFGKVYRGESKQYGTVAVKQLDKKWGQGDREFVTEVTLLSQYKHENIVSLLGFCKEGGEQLLVYKFETNGSLESLLKKKELTWIQCLRICLDAARGLQFLHDEVGSKQRIIHRDVKSSNILLDENLKAKISDFGLSKMGPANQTHTFLISNVCGTPGYVDPECFRTYTFTQKSDVYSFGVVLLEVLCGKPAYIIEEKPGEQPQILAKVALEYYKKGTLEQIVDSNLRNQMAKDSFDRFSFIASQCLVARRENRPFMSVVVEQLEKALSHQLASRVQDNVTYSPMPIEQSRWNASSSHLDPVSSSRSWKYDVFLSFREDTRNTFVDHLYHALQQQLVLTCIDDVTLDVGDTIGPSFLNAIQESQIAVIIFSENYAESRWCLDELEYIMKRKGERGQLVLPIFYGVKPSDVREQRGHIGQAFAKHELAHNDKVESWRKALHELANLAGWDIPHIGIGAAFIVKVVATILDELSSVNSEMGENLVGMATRTRILKSKLQIGAAGVSMIGIWGPRGSGKTTLATSVYMGIHHQFEGHCIIDNIGEESSKYGLENLQEKLLSTIFNTKFEVPNVAEGKNLIKSTLCRRKVLILLDGVDDLDQLEALAGSHNWFGDGSRLIITTRYKFLLRRHRVDMIFLVSLLSHDEAAWLFNRYAYREDNPVEDYNMLSEQVVSYADGLPLPLRVLGSFLCEKNKGDWKSVLAKLQDVPSRMITDINEMTFYGLEPYQKELFLDIACFFRREEKMKAMEILDACGYDLGIGVEVLKQKGLITISDEEFDMDDIVRKMGHNIVRGENPNNPDKHSRVWKTAEIDKFSSETTTTENDKVEAIKYDGRSSHFSELVSNMKKLRFLWVSNSKFREETMVFESPTFLSNELRYIHLSGYLASPLPEDFRPTKLVILKLDNSLHKEVWKDFKRLPCLKELHLKNAHGLVTTPDFDGLPCLEKLTLQSCRSLKTIHPSLGNHRSLVYASIHQCEKLSTLPTIVQMEKLKFLEIWFCEALLEFPEIQANMDSLKILSLINVGIEVLPSSIGEHCTNLISLKLVRCQQLKSIEGNFHAIKHLQKIEFTGFTQLETLPEDLFDEKCCLEELHLPRMRQPLVIFLPHLLRKLCLNCCSLKDGEMPSNICQLFNLQELDLSENSFSRLLISITKLTQLKFLNLTACHSLVVLPELPQSISILIANDCKSLEVVKDIREDCIWLSQISLRKVGTVSNGERLLHSMLQGKAIESSMSLQLHGLEIPRTFDPPLRKGTTCTLQLPENWYYDYCGFLMCAAVGENYNNGQHITMKHEKGSMIGMNSESAVWKESAAGGLATWVGYVSFGSLRDTEWWDSASNMIWFSINFSYATPYEDRCYDTGFGVKLVPKKSESGTMEMTASSEISDNEKDYSHKFKIKDDSKSALKIVF